ncbi:hypothetical protein [Chitinimonas taiwanensis]|uniref:hypothetical protein n=1 Tax=Chitinimonas taiwanensis TaxID=240412 RepID=UPI0035B35064
MRDISLQDLIRPADEELMPELSSVRKLWASCLELTVRDLDAYLPDMLAGKRIDRFSARFVAGRDAFRFIFSKASAPALQLACDAIEIDPQLIREKTARRYDCTAERLCREANA